VSSPKKQVKLHRFAQAHKYDVNGASRAAAHQQRAQIQLQVVHDPFRLFDAFCLAGCPIYTPAEVVADTLVHVAGVPFGFGASYIMLEEAYARLPQVCGPAFSRTLRLVAPRGPAGPHRVAALVRAALRDDRHAIRALRTRA
jgi:hypothetical protein